MYVVGKMIATIHFFTSFGEFYLAIVCLYNDIGCVYTHLAFVTACSILLSSIPVPLFRAIVRFVKCLMMGACRYYVGI